MRVVFFMGITTSPYRLKKATFQSSKLKEYDKIGR